MRGWHTVVPRDEASVRPAAPFLVGQPRDTVTETNPRAETPPSTSSPAVQARATMTSSGWWVRAGKLARALKASLAQRRRVGRSGRRARAAAESERRKSS